MLQQSSAVARRPPHFRQSSAPTVVVQRHQTFAGVPLRNAGYLVRSASLPSTYPEGKLCVSVDFGTTFSGVSYVSSCLASSEVQQILSWPGATQHFRKIPTCLLYDSRGRVISWGLAAKYDRPGEFQVRCEWCGPFYRVC